MKRRLNFLLCWSEGFSLLRRWLQLPHLHSPWRSENGDADGLWRFSSYPQCILPPTEEPLTLVFFFFILKTLDAIWMVDRVSA